MSSRFAWIESISFSPQVKLTIPEDGNKSPDDVVWDSDQPDKVHPLALLLINGSRQTFRVSLSFRTGYFPEMLPVKLEGKTKDGLYCSGTVNEYEQSNPIDFDVDVENTLVWNAPWRVQGNMEWSLEVSHEGGRTTFENISTTPMAVFGITDGLAPAYKNDGVPLDAVRLFCPPPSKGIRTSIDWVTWVVQLCHASTFDKDPACPIALEDRVHSYRYDVWNGYSGFTHGDNFDLVAWLSHRKNPQRNLTVNCYDQAALVDSVLNLGLPYEQPGPGGKTFITVSKWWKGAPFGDTKTPKFGYIKVTDLVGWGECNNPFFGDESSNQVCSPGAGVQHDFRNHKWVCLKMVQDGKLVNMAADACAGPIARPILKDDYLRQVIDAETSTTKYKGRWDDKWNITAAEELDPTQVRRDIDLMLKELFEANPPRRTNPPPINMEISDLTNALKTAAERRSYTCTWSDKIPGPDAEQYQYHISGPTPDGNQEYMMIVVDKAASFTKAIELVQRRLKGNELAPSAYLQKPDPSNQLGDVYFECKHDAPGKTHVLVYGNYAIRFIGRWAPHSDLEYFSRAVADAIRPHAG